MDADVGDGDTGSGVSRACKEILLNLRCLDFSFNLKSCAVALGEIIANSFGGTSGPLYGSFLSNASLVLKNSGNTIQDFAAAFEKGVQGVQALGKCNVGDRTMYDVLVPVSKLLQQLTLHNNLTSSEISQQVVDEARKAADYTMNLRATKGRTRYLGGKEIGKKDPGCELVFEWIHLLNERLRKDAKL